LASNGLKTSLFLVSVLNNDNFIFQANQIKFGSFYSIKPAIKNNL